MDLQHGRGCSRVVENGAASLLPLSSDGFAEEDAGKKHRARDVAGASLLQSLLACLRAKPRHAASTY